MKKWSFAISVSISAVSLILGILYIFRPQLITQHGWKFDSKALGFMVIAALPWILDRIESFEGFGFKLKQRLDAQSAVIEQQQELLNLMFWFSMEEDLFDTLKNLVESKEFIHNSGDIRNYRIVSEQLKELFNRGYLTRDPKNIGDGEDIGSGKIVNAAGKRFVAERKKLEATGGWNKMEKL